MYPAAQTSIAEAKPGYEGASRWSALIKTQPDDVTDADAIKTNLTRVVSKASIDKVSAVSRRPNAVPIELMFKTEVESVK